MMDSFKKTVVLPLLAISALALGGCTSVTPYQKVDPTRGYSGYYEQSLGSNIWKVRFVGTGDTTYETVQTFWLYRCAELAMERGFAGFEILSDVRLIMNVPATAVFACRDAVIPAQFHLAPILPMDFGNTFRTYRIEADIQLLPAPVAHKPRRVFDARALHDALRPHVEEAKKSGRNVKHHIHEYL